MKNSHFTQVPNNVFDILLPKLTMAELKILLIIIRQTNGWLDETKRKRKRKDRISHSQFIQKSGLSRRIVVSTIQKLIDKKLIEVTDNVGTLLHSPTQRKGKSRLYYGLFLRKESKYTKYENHKNKLKQQARKYRKVATLKHLIKQKKQFLKKVSEKNKEEMFLVN